MSVAESRADLGRGLYSAHFDHAIPLQKQRFQLRADDKTHGLACHKNRVIRFGGRVFKTSHDIIRFQIRVVFENFSLWNSSGQQVEYIFDPNAHATNAGATSTLAWVECDSLAHVGMIALGNGFGQGCWVAGLPIRDS